MKAWQNVISVYQMTKTVFLEKLRSMTDSLVVFMCPSRQSYYRRFPKDPSLYSVLSTQKSVVISSAKSPVSPDTFAVGRKKYTPFLDPTVWIFYCVYSARKC